MKKYCFLVLVTVLTTLVFSVFSPVAANQGNGNNTCPDRPGSEHFCALNPSAKEWAVPACNAAVNGNWFETHQGWETKWFTENCAEEEEEVTPEPTAAPTPKPTTVPTTPKRGFCFTEEVIMATAGTWSNDLATSDIVILSEEKPVNLTNGAKFEYYEDLAIKYNGCELLAAHYGPNSLQSEIVKIGLFWENGGMKARVVETITHTDELSERSPEYGPDGSIYFTRFVTGGNVAYQRFPSGEEKVIGANIAQFAFNEKTGKTAVLLNNGEVRWLDTGRLISDNPEFFFITWKDNLLWGIDREGKIQGNLGLENKKIKVEMEKEFFVYVVGDTRLVAHDKEWDLFLFREMFEGNYEQEVKLDLTGYYLSEGSIVLWSPEE